MRQFNYRRSPIAKPINVERLKRFFLFVSDVKTFAEAEKSRCFILHYSAKKCMFKQAKQGGEWVDPCTLFDCGKKK